MAKINVKKLYLSKITEDSAGNESFDIPEYVPGVQQVDHKQTINTAKNYEEGVLVEQDSTYDSTETTINLGHLSNAQYAKYLGHHVAAEGGVYALADDIAPYVALLYQYEKSNHKMGYKVYYKGKLTEPDESTKQKEGKVDYQNYPVTATFQPLNLNGMVKYTVEEDDPNCPAEIATLFFANVIIPGGDNVAPTATTVPLDGAAAVAVGANVVFTFDKAMDANTINGSNIFLMKADGTMVASAITLDDTKKIATIDPAANFTAGDYVAICTTNVKSSYGVKLANAIAVNFTVTA